ncbi:ribonuclease P protein component [Mucilaginibacter terrenus]|uniref:Ribonuclease P protein component n=1 Tax=Mucilaginibacter terrenus TaxID=2482727 RepID=A0A3E2NTI7_9SPHI|nr:ribonuclease P protein component [Mucilaginibacter terrenus]RFZ84314.1 ribonuclease P protein component [Mucilaginibacter terrenus]
MYTFKKEERLCNKKLIDGLFHNGSSFLCYPFKASWMVAAEQQVFPVQVLFTVSKKRYKRAVDRNAVKRRMREAYRLNKQALLYDALMASNKQLILSISYIGKEITPYDFFEKKIIKLLIQLSKELGA